VKKSHVALLLAGILALTLTLPAFGVPSLTGLGKRVTKLSHRVTRISRSQAREKTIIRKVSVLSDDSGSAEGTADCPGNYQVTGGGGEWSADEPSPFDRISASIPDGEGWFVAADSTRGPGQLLTIYVVCARLGS
jgi:hypothetical protein